MNLKSLISVLRGFVAEDELRETALWVAEETTDLNRNELILGYDFEQNDKLTDAINRLKTNEPLQYIFGYTNWKGLNIRVNHSVLIPRPETAELVDWINADFKNHKNLNVIDIGTGSGCIAIGLKKQNPTWNILGIDISDSAIIVAKENAKINDTDILFEKHNIFDENGDFCKYDILVSNPPYITEEEKKDMNTRVVDYEPAEALFVSNNDPLIYYRKIAQLGKNNRSTIYFEINQRFAEELKTLFISMGYKNVELRKDIYGNNRMMKISSF